MPLTFSAPPRTVPIKRRDRIARPRGRRACVALLTAAAVFACVELGAGLWMKAGAQRDPGYGWRLKRLHDGLYAAGGRACNVIVLGSSRTVDGLRGRDLDAPLSDGLGRPVVVTNFSLHAVGPISELLYWKRLREDGVRPDLLVIEVLPRFLSEADFRIDLGADRMPVDRLSRSDLPILERYMSDVRPAIRHDWRVNRLNPVYSHRLTILNRVAPALVPFTVGFAFSSCLPEDNPLPASGRDNVSPEVRATLTSHARADYERTLGRFCLGGRHCEALRDLLASCKQDGVPAAMLVMPEGPLFRSWYAPGAYEEVRGWLQSLGEEFGCSLIDAHEWMPDEEAFMDSHHLLPTGAARFTQRLGKEGLLPLLKKNGE